MNRSTMVRAGFGVLLLTSFAVAHAGVVNVPYTGSYDERTSAPGGDYDAIGGDLDVGQFNLLAGNNYFLGGIRTPNDSSDAFLISIGAGLKIVGASIEWGNSASDFNPILILSNPGPMWTLEEFDSDPTIFLQNLGGNWSGSPLFLTAPSFERGPGLYSMIIGNGTFAMYEGTPVTYRMDFIVESTAVVPPSSVPEPASLALLGLGLAGIGLSRRKRV